jgi:glyoxylase-like metal-dependent hydrolase (beta-lactamase superfamily II)
LSNPSVIDTKMHGLEGITAAFVVRAERTALVETGPLSSLPALLQGLAALGVDEIDDIVVTHIHLDHAGAAGALARRWPRATVHVHEVGAPHLADPSKLWASAARIYGDEMKSLWGGIEPVPPERIRALADGDVVDLGGRTLTAFDTPGHAYHHHAYLDSDSGTLFTGDALGVRLPNVGVLRPATPPPEFNLERAIASIERIAGLGAARLTLTHFGPGDEGKHALGVSELCDAAIAVLRRWADWVVAARAETTDLDDAALLVAERARAALEGTVAPEDLERLEHTTSYRMNTWGYMRYFDKAASSSDR